MSMTTLEAAGFMSMKPETIRNVVPVEDGHLVTTSEGAQTLIAPDGRCLAVLPRREVLNLVGRGSVRRFAEEQAAVPVADLTPVDELPDEPVEAVAAAFEAGEKAVTAPPAPAAPARRAPAKRAPARRPARRA